MSYFDYMMANYASMVILIPFIILTLYAQGKVKTNYAKYSKTRSMKGSTGYEVATTILQRNGINDVQVMMTGGTMSDHYDPRSKAVRLSKDVYSGTSIASLAIAAHECGHAIQHDKGYTPLKLRTSILPVAMLGSNMAWGFLMLGFLFYNDFLMNLGIVFFGAAVLFQIITLPVEFNASSRAMKQLSANGFLYEDEVNGARKMLNAAAMTYVAAAAMAIAQLLRLILIRNARD